MLTAHNCWCNGEEGIMRNISLKLFEYMRFSGRGLKMFLF